MLFFVHARIYGKNFYKQAFACKKLVRRNVTHTFCKTFRIDLLVEVRIIAVRFRKSACRARLKRFEFDFVKQRFRQGQRRFAFKFAYVHFKQCKFFRDAACLIAENVDIGRRIYPADLFVVVSVAGAVVFNAQPRVRNVEREAGNLFNLPDIGRSNFHFFAVQIIFHLVTGFVHREDLKFVSARSRKREFQFADRKVGRRLFAFHVFITNREF